jgi:hypothetical protein
MNLSYHYPRMPSHNIEVSFSVVLVLIMNACYRWHIACEIDESHDHILVTCTPGSCDVCGALRRHNDRTKSSPVKGKYLGENGDVPVSQCCTRLSSSPRCKGTNPRKDAAQIIASIWRKWDIVNDRPLPEGVERVWREHEMKSEVVWKKPERPYYTSMPILAV